MFFIALQARPAGSGSSRSSHANPRWGVVQLVGHLTVNEDGEGSNPSAPAKFPLYCTGFGPVTPRIIYACYPVCITRPGILSNSSVCSTAGPPSVEGQS